MVQLLLLVLICARDCAAVLHTISSHPKAQPPPGVPGTPLREASSDSRLITDAAVVTVTAGDASASTGLTQQQQVAIEQHLTVRTVLYG